MAKTGFTKQGNLSEVSKANQVLDNLLVGAAQPFSRDDVTIFRNNLQFPSYLDFIPNGNIFQLTTLLTTGNLAGDSIRADVSRISDACPAGIDNEVPHLGGTLNLSVQVGDSFLNSPTTQKENLITFISKPDSEPDVGFFNTENIFQNGEGAFSITAGEGVFIKKNNKANYSPGTGRFTFGNDLEYHYSNGDLVTGIFIKGHESPFNISPRADTPSIYPLKVSEYRKDINGQFSFILKLANESPLLFKNSPSTAGETRIFKGSSPGLFRFDSPDIIRFQRKLPVNANDFFGNVPPLFRASNGPETFQTLVDETTTQVGLGDGSSNYGAMSGFEDIDQMYNIGEEAAPTDFGNEAAAFTESTVITYNSAINKFIGNLINNRELANKAVITSKKNFYNDTQFPLSVEGSIIIQDPKVINSPDGIPPYHINRLAPATYIQEINVDHVEGDDCPFLYRRAFSTFDGPWSSSPRATSTAADGAKIFTHGDNPAHAEYVKDLSVDGLEFEDDIQIEKYNSDGLVTQQAKHSVNATEASGGFEFKMPIKIAETDPLTGEIEDATYFLLLRHATTFFTATMGLQLGSTDIGSGGTILPAGGLVTTITEDGTNTFTLTLHPGTDVQPVGPGSEAITVTGGRIKNITTDSGVASSFNTTTQVLEYTASTNGLANTSVTYTFTYEIGNRDNIEILFELEDA